MTIQTIPLTHKIGCLPAFLVEPDLNKTVTVNFERYADAVRDTIADNFIETDSLFGSVGVIYKWEFFLVPTFHEDDAPRVGVIDLFPESLKAHIYFMGYFHGKHLMISNCDYLVVPRTDLEINRDAWYECYSRGGIVVFAKVE